MSISKFLALSLVLSGEVAFAQCYEGVSEEVRQVGQGVQGIFLTGQRDEVIPEGRPDMIGIQIMDIDVPGGTESLADALTPFLGQPMTKETVIQIKQKIMTYYVDMGFSMIAVEAPKQRTKGGVVQFVVIRQTFGTTIYCGDPWYSPEKMNRILEICPCEEFCEEDLRNNIAWLNRNPFQFTNVKFVPGACPDVLDLEFETKSRRPLLLYVRGDDTGSFNTGYGRLYAGFVFGNVLNRGDLLSFEYETSNSFKRLQEYSANYTNFLRWKHIFSVYAMTARVKPSQTITPLGTTNCFDNLSCPSPTKNRKIGKVWQVLPRYTIPFKPFYCPLEQSLTFGFDFKNTNTSITNLLNGFGPFLQTNDPTEVGEPEEFADFPQPAPIRNQINVTQFYLGYRYHNVICNNDFFFNINCYYSPFQWLSHQTNSDYNRLRYHAKTKYFYMNVAAGDIYTVPCVMKIAFLLRGQVSSDSLPPTELFSVGGYNTVRGYHESESVGDNALVANLELRTLPISVRTRYKDELILLAFVDFGLTNNWHINPNLNPHYRHTQWLLGVGPGIRYAIYPTFQLRCDYGFKCHRLFSRTVEDKKLHRGFGQLHVGAMLTY